MADTRDSTINENLSLLDEAKIQTQVLVPVLRALHSKLGEEKVNASSDFLHRVAEHGEVQILFSVKVIVGCALTELCPFNNSVERGILIAGSCKLNGRSIKNSRLPFRRELVKTRSRHTETMN